MKKLDEGVRVAVIAAMRQELQPFLKRFALRPEPLGSGRMWRGRAGSHDVVAVVTSMGTEAATRATARLLDAHPVDFVFVVGIAGGIAEDVRIGELLNPEVVVHEETGVEVRPTSMWNEAPRGRLLTTDTLHDSAALEGLRSQGFRAVDMETAAIGATAEARGLAWSAFRAVSDHAGDPKVDLEVVGLAREDGTPNLPAVARFVLTKPWRIPKLALLGRGMNRAIRVSTAAVSQALGA